MKRPPSTDIPKNTDGMTGGQVRELADAYLDLLRMMTEALEECETDWGFFRWSGRGFNVTGHPPQDLP